jgi:hypothetical protein
MSTSRSRETRQQLGGEAFDEAFTFARWDYSKFENDNGRCSGQTRTSAATGLTRRLAPNTFNKFTARAITATPWRSVLGALYVGADTSDNLRSPDRAQQGVRADTAHETSSAASTSPAVCAA